MFQSEGTFTFPSCRSSCSTRGRPTGNKKQRRDDLDEPEHKYHTAAPFSPHQQMLTITCSRWRRTETLHSRQSRLTTTTSCRQKEQIHMKTIIKLFYRTSTSVNTTWRTRTEENIQRNVHHVSEIQTKTATTVTSSSLFKNVITLKRVLKNNSQ